MAKAYRAAHIEGDSACEHHTNGFAMAAMGTSANSMPLQKPDATQAMAARSRDVKNSERGAITARKDGTEMEGAPSVPGPQQDGRPPTAWVESR
jgi:hypothetical protein